MKLVAWLSIAVFTAQKVLALSHDVNQARAPKTCTLQPRGIGLDDTDNVEQAIASCGHNGRTIFQEGMYNITRKMTWDLKSSTVDLHGYLNFVPDIQSWLNASNTYRVVFIQSQASWFVLTGNNFTVDAHNTGGIQGNGQPWWEFFQTHTREDGDGRPISLTVYRAQSAIIKNFRIESPPFWSNAVAESSDVVYDGMFVNATNTDPSFFGENIVPNTDGIDTYRSNNISMLNWDITCGDDCLAIKGNSTDILAKNITCRGGNGVAFGSLGQYANLSDIVANVHLENIFVTRLDPKVQPNMESAVYFKTWTGTINGAPPTGGGGGTGFVTNVVSKNVSVDRADSPLHLFQTNGGHTGDLPSTLMFSNLSFEGWHGAASTNLIVNIECSPAVGCDGISFDDFNVTAPAAEPPRFICQNVKDLTGLSAPCNATGQA